MIIILRTLSKIRENTELNSEEEETSSSVLFSQVNVFRNLFQR